MEDASFLIAFPASVLLGSSDNPPDLGIPLAYPDEKVAERGEKEALNQFLGAEAS